MPHYVDGFVIPIPRKNIKSYKKMATLGRDVWMDHGALHYYECIADDFVKHGLGFKKLCKLKSSETVIFAFIVYKSKAHRERVNKKVMKDPRMLEWAPTGPMPFDMKKFAMAGCKTVVRG